jgi:DUF4097 and DUF4098 domain-containing protein YvlB
MKTKIALALAGMLAFTTLSAIAQDAEHSWSKTYPVTGKPALTLETSDASVQIHSCGDCREIRVRAEVVGQKLTDYRLEENQNGDHVYFLFKEKPQMGIHISWHKVQTRVTVETPTELTLDARTSDGNLDLAGLRGDIALKTGDGNVTLDQISGKLRVESGDGHVNITNAAGALEARMSDGNLNVDGSFETVKLRTSDGQLDLKLRAGTKLTEASTIQSSDGSITLHLPQDFAADLDVHTSDGHVNCALPLTMDHYQSSGSEGHALHGRLNGGGTPLTIHTSDGSVRIERL